MSELHQDIAATLWFDDNDPHHSEFEASNSLAAQVAKQTGLKPFPAIAHKVSQAVSNPDCGIDSLTKLIRTDPAIAARLMRLANSALFKTGSPASSLDQALLRLGTSTIHQMVTAIAVMGLFPGRVEPAKRVRAHCVGSAAVAKLLGERQRFLGSSQLFLACLMHDLGQLLLIQSDELDYSQEEETEQTHERERRQLGYDHAVLGAHVLRTWDLPELICQTVALHHQPDRGYAQAEDLCKMVAFTRLSSYLDSLLARGATRIDDDVQLEREWEITRLSAESVNELWEELGDARGLALSTL